MNKYKKINTGFLLIVISSTILIISFLAFISMRLFNGFGMIIAVFGAPLLALIITSFVLSFSKKNENVPLKFSKIMNFSILGIILLEIFAIVVALQFIGMGSEKKPTVPYPELIYELCESSTYGEYYRVRKKNDFTGHYLTIPQEYKGVPVLEIADYGFENCEDVFVADLSGIRVIGDHAFYKCENLESAYLSQNIDRIGDYAFSYCSSLREIVINKLSNEVSSGISINVNVFQACTNLHSISINTNVFFIGEHFLLCDNLGTIKYDGYTNDFYYHYNDDFLKGDSIVIECINGFIYP